MGRPKGHKSPVRREPDGSYIRKVCARGQGMSDYVGLPAEYVEAMAIPKGTIVRLRMVDGSIVLTKGATDGRK